MGLLLYSHFLYMNSKALIWIIILIVIAGGAALWASSSNPSDDSLMMEGESMMEESDTMMESAEDHMTEKDSSEAMKKDGEATKEGDSMMEDEGSDTMMASAGTYEAYSAEKVAMAAAKGPVVLFFHAAWCPTCRSLNNDIEANMANIPAGTTILKVDYDTETELKKKYGVTYQHTMVQIDADGSLIKKWSGSPSLASLVSSIEG